MSPIGRASLVAALLLAGCGRGGDEGQVVIDALSQPRGLSVNETTLCIAEAGAIGPDGPARQRSGQLEADTGRILCVPLAGGEAVVMMESLPFVYYPDAAVTSGATDVISDGDDLYILVGESYGELSRSVVGFDGNESRVLVDLLDFAQAQTPPNGGVRSNPYSFVVAPDGEGFYIADAASGTVLWGDLEGRVETFATVPGHEVLTGITWGPDGDLYVASFGQLPHPHGSGAVVAVDAEGTHRVVVDGLTMVIDVGFDAAGGLLILEYSAPPTDPSGTDAYRDDTGRLTYVPPDGVSSTRRVLLDDLNRPTALAVRSGDVFISVSGGERAHAEGSVQRYALAALLKEGR